MIKKKALALLSLLVITSFAQAYHFGDEVCCQQENACCEDATAPLVCGSWGIQVKGGVVPIHNTKQGPVYLFGPNLERPITLFDIPKFNHVYKTPWLVGGELSYACTEYIQLFGEVNYYHASGRNYEQSLTFEEQTGLIRSILTPYKSIGGYIGTRFFCDRWFDILAPFVGFKVGLRNHKEIDATQTINGVRVPSTLRMYLKNTVVSGGAQLGFDTCVWSSLKFVFTAEVVAVAGARPNRNVVLPESSLSTLTGFSQGDVGTEVSFPITFGLRYDF